jgi:S1-C subfamily serine protease
MKRFLTFLFFAFSLSYVFAAKTHSQIGDEFGETIVSVNVARKDGTTHSGTGFIVHKEGVVATAGHVINNAVFLNLTFKNGAISEEASVIALSKNKEIDLALLKINALNLPHVVFKNSDYVRAGEEITVIGNPRRLQNTITNGLISQIRQVSKDAIWQQISAPISPSSSGSPVFNSNGYVIGVAFSSLKGNDNQNLNFAIPSNYLMRLMMENNIVPDMGANRLENQPRAALKRSSLFDKIKNHIKKSWYILKVKILKIKPKAD